jgi:anti-anti-sigma factor
MPLFVNQATSSLQASPQDWVRFAQEGEPLGSTLRICLLNDLLYHTTGELSGQIDLQHAALLQAKRVVLDLTAIDHIDSKGIQLIVQLFKQLTEAGIRFRVDVPPNSLLHTLNACRLNSFIETKVIEPNTITPNVSPSHTRQEEHCDE